MLENRKRAGDPIWDAIEGRQRGSTEDRLPASSQVGIFLPRKEGSWKELGFENVCC